jgi:hypothetical protein
LESVKAPEPVIYKPSQVCQLYKKSQEPVTDSPKASKSSRKKSAKKKQTLAKIEAEITRQANIIPLQPGMGRGFCQQRPSSSSGTIKRPDNNLTKSTVSKPCAVICPTKREIVPDFNLEDKPRNFAQEEKDQKVSEPGQNADEVIDPIKYKYENDGHSKANLLELDRGKNLLSENGKEGNWFSEPRNEKNVLPNPGRIVGRGRGIATLSADMLQQLGKF